MKVLITGVSGFVGQYLKKELESADYEVIGIGLSKQYNNFYCNVLNRESVIQIVMDIKPDIIVHLAAQPRVNYSWDNPIDTLKMNTLSSLNILDAVSHLEKHTRTLFIGSSEQYGLVKTNGNFVDENVPTKPANPYAISKQAQEDMVLSLAHKRNLDVVLTRSFNHIGPRQRVGMVIPDFASEIVKIEKGEKKSKLYVGNLKVSRDFTDVRDIVRAYRLLIERGVSNEVYNVGSGRSFSLKDILEYMISLSTLNIEIVIDKNKLRPYDIPELISNNKKITSICGWEPLIDINDTLKEILDHWRKL